MEFARKHGKPHLHLCAGNDASADNLRAFFECHRVKGLNVAGPRASTEPGVGEFVRTVLDKAFVGMTAETSIKKKQTRSVRS